MDEGRKGTGSGGNKFDVLSAGVVLYAIALVLWGQGEDGAIAVFTRWTVLVASVYLLARVVYLNATRVSWKYGGRAQKWLQGMIVRWGIWNRQVEIAVKALLIAVAPFVFWEAWQSLKGTVPCWLWWMGVGWFTLLILYLAARLWKAIQIFGSKDET